jgi:hypothetical protein
VVVINLPDAVKHSIFTKRLILDNSVQWLEHVLVALKHVYNSYITNFFVPGVLDDMFIITDHTNFVRIIISVIKN